MLDIHQLNLFLAAAETLSFTQAAARLHMTQPSISQHIKSLENHFGCELFIRNGRSLELTDAGLALVPLAQEAVSLSVRIDETMASLNGDVVGHLIVGCSTTPGKYVLPQLLAHFHEHYPRVRATCQVSSQHQTLQMLLNGEAHFALASITEQFSPDLEFHLFLRDHVVLIAPLNHPWAERIEIEPGDLQGTHFILREESSGTYAAVREALSKFGISIKNLDTLLTLGNSEAIAMAVQEGLGVGFVSEMVVRRMGEERLARVKIRGMDIYREIYFARNPRRPATVAQTAFWNFLSKEKFMLRHEPVPN